MRTHIMHMHKAQNSPSTPAGESRRTWRVYRPRQLAREGGGSAAVRVAKLRDYHVFDQHAEAHAGTRSLHRAVPFLPHRDSHVFIVSRKSWVRKVLVNFFECPGGGKYPFEIYGANMPLRFDVFAEFAGWDILEKFKVRWHASACVVSLLPRPRTCGPIPVVPPVEQRECCRGRLPTRSAWPYPLENKGRRSMIR